MIDWHERVLLSPFVASQKARGDMCVVLWCQHSAYIVEGFVSNGAFILSRFWFRHRTVLYIGRDIRRINNVSDSDWCLLNKFWGWDNAKITRLRAGDRQALGQPTSERSKPLPRLSLPRDKGKILRFRRPLVNQMSYNPWDVIWRLDNWVLFVVGVAATQKRGAHAYPQPVGSVLHFKRFLNEYESIPTICQRLNDNTLDHDSAEAGMSCSCRTMIVVTQQGLFSGNIVQTTGTAVTKASTGSSREIGRICEAAIK